MVNMTPRQLHSRGNRFWFLAPSTLKLVFHGENRGDWLFKAGLHVFPHLLLFPPCKPIWSRLLGLHSHPNPRLSWKDPVETWGEEPTVGANSLYFSDSQANCPLWWPALSSEQFVTFFGCIISCLQGIRHMLWSTCVLFLLEGNPISQNCRTVGYPGASTFW